MTHTNDVVQNISKVISLKWGSEMEKGLHIKSEFFTAIIIEVGTFGSQIADEQHFQTEDEAREFTQTMQEGQIAVIAKVS